MSKSTSQTSTLPPANTLPPSTPAPTKTGVATTTTRPVSKNSEIITLFKGSEIAAKSKYLACRPGSGIIEAMEANSMAGERFFFSDLPKAKVPTGGETDWKIETIVGPEMTKEIKGVLVVYQKAGVLWPRDKMAAGSKPLLVTSDLIDAVQVSDDFGDLDQMAIEACFTHQDERGRNHYDWEKLPYNEWGSGQRGGKRCKEQRLICVLRENDNVPVFLRVPPASVGAVHTFVKKLTLQTQRPHYEAIVSVTLNSTTNAEGTPYSEVKIVGAGFVSKEEGAFFKAMYTDSLQAAMQEATVSGDESTDEQN